MWLSLLGNIQKSYPESAVVKQPTQAVFSWPTCLMCKLYCCSKILHCSSQWFLFLFKLWRKVNGIWLALTVNGYSPADTYISKCCRASTKASSSWCSSSNFIHSYVHVCVTQPLLFQLFQALKI